MKTVKKHWGIFAPMLLIIAAVLALLAPVVPVLHVTGESRELNLPLAEGEEVSIKYTHAVNHSPVIDTIERTGDILTVRRSLFLTYGAGIPILGDEVGDTYEETEDGFLLSGIDAGHEEIALLTGAYADHRLLWRSRELVLKEYFGEQALIRLRAGSSSLLGLITRNPALEE